MGTNVIVGTDAKKIVSAAMRVLNSSQRNHFHNLHSGMVTLPNEFSLCFRKSHFTVNRVDVSTTRGSGWLVLTHTFAVHPPATADGTQLRLVYTVTRMGIVRKIKRAVRGEVKPKTIVLEAWRRTRVSRQARHERNNLDRLNSEAPKLRLAKTADLLTHFRSRTAPHFFTGFSTSALAKLHRELFPGNRSTPEHSSADARHAFLGLTGLWSKKLRR